MRMVRLTGVFFVLSTSGVLADPVLDAAYSLTQAKDHVTLDTNSQYKSHIDFPCSDGSSGCFQDKVFKQLDKCRYEIDVHNKIDKDYNIKQEAVYDFRLVRWVEMLRNADGKPTGYKVHGVGDFVCYSGDDNNCKNEYFGGDNNVDDPERQLDHARNQLDIVRQACN